MHPTPARVGDATDISDLRRACAHWQQERGIDQWDPHEITAEDIAAQIARGQWWILRTGPALQAAARLLTHDPHT